MDVTFRNLVIRSLKISLLYPRAYLAWGKLDLLCPKEKELSG